MSTPRCFNETSQMTACICNLPLSFSTMTFRFLSFSKSSIFSFVTTAIRIDVGVGPVESCSKGGDVRTTWAGCVYMFPDVGFCGGVKAVVAFVETGGRPVWSNGSCGEKNIVTKYSCAVHPVHIVTTKAKRISHHSSHHPPNDLPNGHWD